MGLIMFAFSATGQTVNMNRWIELTVTQGEWIGLYFAADEENTGVKVKSGEHDTILSVGTDMTDWRQYYAETGTMKVYGNVNKFDCSEEFENLTGINLSNNSGLLGLFCHKNNLTSLAVSGLTALKVLSCSYNNLSSLDVSGLTALEDLDCHANNLTSLDVSGLIALKELWCDNNNLTSLDISGLTALKVLWCDNNNLTALDFSGLTALENLDCGGNNLTALDVSGLTALKFLQCQNNNLSNINISGCDSINGIYCWGNSLSACGLDSLFHQLPIRTEGSEGYVDIKKGTYTNPGTNSCRDTIATNRNWEIWDYDGGILVNANYSCPYFTIGIAEIKAEDIVAKVYPNPVSNALNVETMEKVEDIILYDVLGKEVLRTTKTNNIDVSNLNNGLYILKLITEKGIGEYKIVKE